MAIQKSPDVEETRSAQLVVKWKAKKKSEPRVRGGLSAAGWPCLCGRAFNKFSSSLAHAIVVNGKNAAQNRIRLSNGVVAGLASNATVVQGSSDQACWVVWVWTKLLEVVRARCWRHRWRAGGTTRQVRISSWEWTWTMRRAARLAVIRSRVR